MKGKRVSKPIVHQPVAQFYDRFVEGIKQRIRAMNRLAGNEEIPDKEATDFTERLEQLRVRSDASQVLRKLAGMLLIFREESFTSFWLA
jgi:hypothetical protein